MEQKNLIFDPQKDIKEVDQFGFVDLRSAFENGYVPANIEADDSAYNNIDNPSSIVGRPKDAFEAMRMQDKLVEGVKSSVKSEPAKASSDKTEN